MWYISIRFDRVNELSACALSNFYMKTSTHTHFILFVQRKKTTTTLSLTHTHTITIQCLWEFSLSFANIRSFYLFPLSHTHTYITKHAVTIPRKPRRCTQKKCWRSLTLSLSFPLYLSLSIPIKLAFVCWRHSVAFLHQ